MNTGVQGRSIGDGESSFRMIAGKLHTTSVSPHLIPKIIIAPASAERAQIDAYGIVTLNRLNNERQPKWKMEHKEYRRKTRAETVRQKSWERPPITC